MQFTFSSKIGTKMEKKVYLISVLIFSLILMSFPVISAINLNVKATPVSDAYIKEFSQPAVFNLEITNNEDNDYFTAYSLVGVEISPSKPFVILSKETKNIQIELTPGKYVQTQKGYFVFEFNIKNQKGEIQKQKISINILDLRDAVLITPQILKPGAESINITIKNIAMYDLGDVKIKITAPFFETEQTLSMKPFESHSIVVPIDSEKLRLLEAGEYKIDAQIEAKGKKTYNQIPLTYAEEENIKTTESTTGFLIRDYNLVKDNQGNVKKTITVTKTRSIIAYLFTTFDNKPSETRINGLVVKYTWEKPLAPGDELNLTMTTNWFYPLLILICILLVIYIIAKYIEEDVSLRKSVSYVKTKGGEFALRVTVRIKPKKALTNIKIIDTLPHLVNLYEKFGAIAPDNVDMKERKLQWNVDSLEAGQEKIFSYIIYSKVGVVGKFELPKARAAYEHNSKLKTMFSNKAVYVNEQ